MKQFIVDRHTTPNTPTLEQVPTDKIPIYENRAAVEADLANLSVGQIVATADTGDELAQPVDVVEEDNLHAVSSNAVAESLSYSETEQKTGGVWIDGKSIYRKVVPFTIPSTDFFAYIDISSFGISNVIRFDIIGNSYKQYFATDKDKLRAYRSDNNTFTIFCGGDLPTRPISAYLLLEYTKPN